MHISIHIYNAYQYTHEVKTSVSHILFALHYSLTIVMTSSQIVLSKLKARNIKS